MATPQINTQTANELLDLVKQKAQDVSGNQINSFPTGSLLLTLFESIVVAGTEVIDRVNNLSTTLQSQRLLLFGLERKDGTEATGTIRVTLDALYANPFTLASGFQISFNGVQFETTTDVTIAAYGQTGEATINATDAGIAGNVPVNAIATYEAVARIGTIELVEETRGGTDAETDQQWSERVTATVRRRETLLTEDDFEEDLKDYLGGDSLSLAIGRLKDDGTYQNGYVSVFGLNADGTQLNDAQLAQLQSYYVNKVPMATVIVSSMEVYDLNLEAIAGYLTTFDPQTLANNIYKAISDYLKPGNLTPGRQILNKAIEYEIGNVTGVEKGVYSVKINGFAQPQSLPNLWTVGRIKTCKIVLTSENQTFTYNYPNAV